MEFVIIASKEALDRFIIKMTDRYGKQFSDRMAEQMPQTFPCIVFFEIWYNDCYPDQVMLQTIEKRTLEDRTLWSEFDVME